MNVIEKVFGTHSERELKRILPIVDKIESLRDDMMALMLARESFKYGELHDRARTVLLSKNQTPDPVNKVKQLMLTASIQGNTLLNSTTSHMAEMLIRGSSMGMTSLWKAMNRNEKADGQALELAGELLDFEENNIRELKRYL